MKKFLIVLGLALAITAGSENAQAQTTGNLKTTLTGSKTTDTCTNMVDTVLFVYNAGTLTHGSLQINAIRISGSPVLTCIFEQSNDGVLWSAKAVADTANLKPLANANKSATFPITQNNYLYYRVRVLGHAAAAAQIRAWYVIKKD